MIIELISWKVDFNYKTIRKSNRLQKASLASSTLRLKSTGKSGIMSSNKQKLNVELEKITSAHKKVGAELEIVADDMEKSAPSLKKRLKSGSRRLSRKSRWLVVEPGTLANIRRQAEKVRGRAGKRRGVTEEYSRREKL